jgi:hypothetical protein
VNLASPSLTQADDVLAEQRREVLEKLQREQEEASQIDQERKRAAQREKLEADLQGSKKVGQVKGKSLRTKAEIAGEPSSPSLFLILQNMSP